jgi:hypothetical protein
MGTAVLVGEGMGTAVLVGAGAAALDGLGRGPAVDVGRGAGARFSPGAVLAVILGDGRDPGSVVGDGAGVAVCPVGDGIGLGVPSALAATAATTVPTAAAAITEVVISTARIRCIRVSRRGDGEPSSGQTPEAGKGWRREGDPGHKESGL